MPSSASWWLLQLPPHCYQPPKFMPKCLTFDHTRLQTQTCDRYIITSHLRSIKLPVLTWGHGFSGFHFWDKITQTGVAQLNIPDVIFQLSFICLTVLVEKCYQGQKIYQLPLIMNYHIINVIKILIKPSLEDLSHLSSVICLDVF